MKPTIHDINGSFTVYAIDGAPAYAIHEGGDICGFSRELIEQSDIITFQEDVIEFFGYKLKVEGYDGRTYIARIFEKPE